MYVPLLGRQVEVQDFFLIERKTGETIYKNRCRDHGSYLFTTKIFSDLEHRCMFLWRQGNVPYGGKALICLDKSMFVTTFNLESGKADFVVSSSHFILV